MQASGIELAGEAAQSERSRRHASYSGSAPPIIGRMLVFVKVLWCLAAVFAAVLALAALFANYSSVTGPTAHVTVQAWLNGWTADEALSALNSLSISTATYSAYRLVVEALFVLVFFAVASLIFWRNPSERVAVFISFFLLLFGANWIVEPARMPATWEIPLRVIYFTVWGCVPIFFAIFPNGRFVPGWIRFFIFGAPLVSSVWYVRPELDTVVGGPVFVVVIGVCIYAQIYRYRRVSGVIERQQTKWVIFSIAPVYLVISTMVCISIAVPEVNRHSSTGLLFITIGTSLVALTFLLIPISIAIAVMRYRLWNINLILTRTILYGSLTASVIVIYVLVVGGTGFLLQSGPNVFLSLVATGVVAVLFQPIRERVQRAANRLVYGERDDPYTVIVRLGQHLESTEPAGAVPDAIVGTVMRAMRLPYAALQLNQGGQYVTAASGGVPGDELVSLPLLYQGEDVGRLQLATRTGEKVFAPADLRLLQVLARQAGVAAYAVRLTSDLQRSRERLVTALEEERRRLRRDLHDGLGPMLAAQTLKIGTARVLLEQNPKDADKLLSELEDDISTALADIRRLVYNLRPPSLDQLGLLGALREAARQYSLGHGEGSLDVKVEGPGKLPPLPAAVEVALYMIAQEAITNVARHSGARQCKVQLEIEGGAQGPTEIKLTVTDNGRGIAPDYMSGVGMSSMRERVQELSGTFQLDSPPEGGTRVAATLYLGANS